VKIALVHDWLTGMRGGEKCLEVFCRRFPDAQLFTLLHAPGSTFPVIERMRITTSFLQRLPAATRHYRYLLPLMPAAVERLAIPDDIELVLSFSHAVAKSVKPPPGVPHVCYCFTPMRYAWQRRADYFVGQERFRQTPLAVVRNLLLDRLRQWDHQTSGRVTHFIAISRTVARRIAESYGRPSRVIYPPVDTHFYTPAPTAREDYYLCLSALVPYKRIEVAIEACNRLRRRLVVIGDGPQRRRLAGLAGPTVTLAGWLSGEEIRQHLRRARAMLFPAHEDFGIAPLEAQACGMPVIAFGEGGATETVLPAGPEQPGTGLFFDQQTWSSLAAAILRLESHPDWFSASLARQQAERFTVERFEQEMIAYLEEVQSAWAVGSYHVDVRRRSPGG
jgi:glycosyltransferase involved in cell wall biosynthesis